MINKEIKNCRICKSSFLVEILDLKYQPPANSLQRKELKIKRYPLKLLCCKNCQTAQLSISLSPKSLFNKYVWVTGTSSTAHKHSVYFYNKVSKYLKKKTNVLEIASNDGTFLKPFKKNNYQILGVDPAKNIAKKASLGGIKTIPNFFNYDFSKKLKRKKFSLIFARNVLPHVNNIQSVIKGISNLSDKGTFVAIEFHYASDIIKDLQYDSIYHEHIFYFTVKSISNLFQKHDLKPFEVFNSPISGGSLILLFSKSNRSKSKKLIKIEQNEKRNKINNIGNWRKFGKNSITHSKKFVKKIMREIEKNKTIFGYGASARSSTLLNFCNLNSTKIKFIIDQNPMKNNLYTPGTNIPIYRFEKVKSKLGKMSMVLLAWNFKSEIVSFMRKKKFKNNIIIPFSK